MKFEFRRKHLGIPYILFMLFFVVLPLLVICYYAFTNGQGKFSVENFLGFFQNTKTIGTLLYSLVLSVVTTLVCLIIAYPVAYILANGGIKHRNVILLLFVLPMWINFTLRITAMKEILTVLEHNLAFHPFLNSVICMTYDFLPFMILPLYNSLTKIDRAYMEAAADLGAKHTTVFLRIVLPLSVPGIVSGVTMVLLPAMTNYVVLDMVYNSTYIMGSLIGSYFNSYDWHNGSVIAIILLMIIFAITLVTGHFSEEKEDRRGGTVL